MKIDQFPSQLLERAVSETAKLPSVGRKTALRLVLHLLRKDAGVTHALADSLLRLRNEVKYCTHCHNISDHEVCEICADERRNQTQICVVENVQNVMAIESTGIYAGLYHVLGGVISPMDGVAPGDLTIASLVDRVRTGKVNEVIFALNPTMMTPEHPVRMSVLARGIGVGDDLEFADEVTLGRSLVDRVDLKN